MRKILFFCAALFCAFGLQAQTYTHGGLTVVITDTMTHDSTNCNGSYTPTWNITVASSFLGDSVMVGDTSMYGGLLGTYYNTTGASPWTFSQNFTGTMINYDIVSAGSYMYWSTDPWIKVAGTADTLWNVVGADSFFVTNPCAWSYMQGMVYIDYNADCTFDSTDVGLNNFTLNYVEYLSSPADSIFAGPQEFDSSGGYYNFTVQQSWMTNYKVSLPSSYAFLFPTSPCFAGTGYVMDTVACTNANFPLLCSSNIDLECGILSAAGKVRLHRPFTIHPYVNNSGCDPQSGQMILVLDSHVIYDSALTTNPPSSVHGDTLIWNYTDLSSLAGGSYWNSFFSEVYLTFDSTITAGDSVCFQVYTGIPAADINPSNNSYSFCLPVVYSFDPNSKDVSPAGMGAQGYIPYGQDTLTYTIHFQNTGSDYAENVVVIDTLNGNFDMHSLKVLSATSQMTPTWLAPNVVSFNFNEIFLIDSFDNEPASHGAVQFSIVTNPGVAHGTQIRNTGYIYFDVNPPVITNTTLNTIALVNGVASVKAPAVKVYPNPATDMINVENLDGGKLQIIDIKGETMIELNVSGSKTTIDVSRLPPGVYLLKVIQNQSSEVTRFTKF